MRIQKKDGSSLKISFRLKPRRNYNEFRSWMRWRDYISIMLLDFPFLLVRRYDWLSKDIGSYTLLFQLLVFTVTVIREFPTRE